MKHLLNQLLAHQKLTYDDARTALASIAAGEVNDAQIAAFITVFLMRNISVDELAGFRDALLDCCVDVPTTNFEHTVDLCGTGGDGKNTFNISTLASLVAAGAGARVVKHGNYGVSSVSGSSNVMEKMGYQFKNNPDALRRELDRAGMCFLHAPLFHPALKNVAAVRRALGIKTFFNMLGPLVNPARPSAQLTGVFNLELGRIYHYLLEKSGKNYAVVHTHGGFDEITLTAPTHFFTKNGVSQLAPEQLGGAVEEAELFGGATVEDAVKIFTEVLENRGTAAQNRVVVANAAVALLCCGVACDLPEGLALAGESLASGRALRVLKKLVND